MDFLILNQLLKYDKEFSHNKCRREFTDTEFIICSFVCQNEGCSQDDISRMFHMDKTTIAKAILKLEQRGCLIRRNDPEDKRKNRLFLPDETKAKVSEILKLHDRWMASILKCLSPEELKQFENYCARLLSEAEKIMKTGE